MQRRAYRSNPFEPARGHFDNAHVHRADDHVEKEARRLVSDGGLVSNRSIVKALGPGAGATPAPSVAIIARLGPGHVLGASLAERAAKASITQDAVRLHTGASAVAFTASIGARAATVGRHIALGRGVGPATHEGQRVIDHELVHVAQGTAKIARNGEDETASPAGVSVSSLGQEDSDLLEAEIEQRFKEADIVFVLEQIGEDSDETEIALWDKLAEDPRARAVKFRAALILQEASITSTVQLHEYLENAEIWAASEPKTLDRIGLVWQERDAWAFPDTWGDQVERSLFPPSGLELDAALSETAQTRAEMMAVAGTIPGYLWDHGLPVTFADALKLTSYPFRSSAAREPGAHAVYDFARKAEDYLPSEVKYRLAAGWAAGKANLVSDVRAGRKTIDPARWAEVSAPRVFQPDLSSLVVKALDSDVDIAASMGADIVDLWHYELALAKLSGFVEILFRLDVASGIAGVFAQSLSNADLLVAGASPDERLDRADVWASAQGYPSAARTALVASLKANAGQIAMDVAKDIAISMIPFIGWGWRIKEAIEEAVDWYRAGEALVDARDRASSADSVVALQRAAAEISSAEMGIAAQVVLTAASKGAEVAVRTAAKAVKGDVLEPVDSDLADPASPNLKTPAFAAETTKRPGAGPAASAPSSHAPAPSAEAVEGVQQAIEVVEREMSTGEAAVDFAERASTSQGGPGAESSVTQESGIVRAADEDETIRLFHGTDQSGFEGLEAIGRGAIDVSRGTEIQDFGRGFYLTLDRTTAKVYASRRGSQRQQSMQHVLAFDIPKSDLGSVVDITEGGTHRAMWDAFLDEPPFGDLSVDLPSRPGFESVRSVLRTNPDARAEIFDRFLARIDMADADTIVGPLGDSVFLGISSGSESVQVCIRSQRVADRLNAIIRGSNN